MEVLAQLANRLRPRLEALYGLQAEDGMTRIMHVCSRYTDLRNRAPRPAWDERDAVLIAYADHVRSQGEPPLATLHRFLTTTGLQRVCRVLHLLPFFPASSDDGFSVIDYRQVDADLGGWDGFSDNFAKQVRLDVRSGLESRLLSKRFVPAVFARSRSLHAFSLLKLIPAYDLSRVIRPRTPRRCSRRLRPLADDGKCGRRSVLIRST